MVKSENIHRHSKWNRTGIEIRSECLFKQVVPLRAEHVIIVRSPRRWVRSDTASSSGTVYAGLRDLDRSVM